MIKVHPGELKKAWVACCSIVDKAMKTHFIKCDFCAWIESELQSLIAKLGDDADGIREKLRTDKEIHRVLVANERAELDDAGYRSMVYPYVLWTLIADGATQRNFVLPKLRKRMPKELANKELFCTKLYGMFLYGWGGQT